MPFNSPLFLFMFAPLIVAVNAVLPVAARLVWLLGASVLFYAWGEPAFVWVVLASSLADYFLVRRMASVGRDGQGRLCLILSVVQNIGLLVYCKYTGFFLDQIRILLPVPWLPVVETALPLAISFLVFEKITYAVDVWRGVSKPAGRLHTYLFFVFFFPKLLAGPIIKFHEIQDQFDAPKVDLDAFSQGLQRFLFGLARKVLVADTLAGFVDRVFSTGAGELSLVSAWLGAIAFAVQIYFDFSGYSDMALGLARMLGFRLRENFNHPYLAVGFTDFWRRWHISLSSWIREYLYFPLGGNRGGPVRTFLNLWLCFLASGLWHGASWNFVIWGIFHGVFVSADHFGMSRVWPRLPVWVGVAVTFVLVVIGWVFFRSPTLGQAVAMLHVMAGGGSGAAATIWPDALEAAILAAGLIGCFLPAGLPARLSLSPQWMGRLEAAQFALLGALAFWSFGRVFATAFTPFIYFRF